MKRFLVFAGSNYYPKGGWDDFRGAHDTLEEAKTAILDSLVSPMSNPKYAPTHDWCHIIDVQLQQRVVFWVQAEWDAEIREMTPGSWSDQ